MHHEVGASDYTERVCRAASEVVAQTDCTIPEALALMKDCAEATGQGLIDVAVAVLERHVRFGSRDRAGVVVVAGEAVVADLPERRADMGARLSSSDQ